MAARLRHDSRIGVLANAIAPRLAAAGNGAIINIGSVVGLAPEFGLTVYGATKAFVLYLSQGLALELGPKGVYVQAVLPVRARKSGDAPALTWTTCRPSWRSAISSTPHWPASISRSP